MRSRLSIGVRWALRYAIAMLLAMTVMGVYVYERVERRIVREAELVVAMQARETAAELARNPSPAAFDDFLQSELAGSDPDLGLGMQIFFDDGRPTIAVGSLYEHAIPLPDEIVSGEERNAFRSVRLDQGYPHLVYALRTPQGAVQVAVYGRRFLRSAKRIRDAMFVASPIAVLVTGLLGWFLARGSLRPIAEITEGARRIHVANLGERLPTTGTGDELDRLATTLNEMMERLQRSVERMRDFSADAAHQLRTPLTALRSQLEVTLEKDRAPDEYRRVLGDVLLEVESMTEGVNAMLRLAHSEAGLDPAQRVPVRLAPLLAEVVEFFVPFAEDEGVRLACAPIPDVVVPGDPAWIHQLFANLVHNAVKYTAAGGSVTVDAEPGQDEVAVRVRDSGVGVEAGERDRIFERFHRVGARQEVHGAGLGLAIAREIARAHGGRIDLESTPGRGSVFTVHLPLEPRKASAR